MLFTAAIASTLFASQISAGFVDGATSGLIRRDNREELYRRYVETIVEPVGKRAAVLTTNTPMTSSGKLDVGAWNTMAEAACTKSLDALKGVASNPAGLAVCYNVPQLNEATGVFQADMRLYNISKATGDFQTIPPQQVFVGLSFTGATVQAVNSSQLAMKRSPSSSSDLVSLISWPRGEEGPLEKRSTAPFQVQSYAFVGQVSPGLMLNVNNQSVVPPSSCNDY